jgi:hypothetical protein
VWKTGRDFYSYSDAEVYLRDWQSTNSRRERRYSIENIALAMKVTPGYICQIFKGKRRIPPGMIDKWVKLSGLADGGRGQKEERAKRVLYFKLMAYLGTARMPRNLKCTVLKKFGH